MPREIRPQPTALVVSQNLNQSSLQDHAASGTLTEGPLSPSGLSVSYTILADKDDDLLTVSTHEHSSFDLDDLPEDEPKPIGFFGWWKPNNLPLRLSNTATFAIIYDTLIAIISVSTEINDFLSKGLPAMVNGALNISPSFFPFFSNIIHIFYPLNNEKEIITKDALENMSEDLEKEIHIDLDALPENDKAKLQKKIFSYEKIQKKLLDERRENKSADKFGMYDNFINTIYLLTRAVGGALTIVKACNDESPETNDKIDEINKWLSVASNSAYLAYMLAHYFPKGNNKKTPNTKTTILEDKTTTIVEQTHTSASGSVEKFGMFSSTVRTITQDKQNIPNKPLLSIL